MEIKMLPYYTRANFELILGNKKRTLDARLKALKKKGIILPLKRGFYLNNQYYQQTLDKQMLLEYISGVLVTPSYISLEYALAFYGFIAEGVYALTCITSKKPRVFTTPVATFAYRNLKPSLFNCFETRYFSDLPYNFASPEKALFDFLYLIPMSTLNTIRQVLSESRINWSVVTPLIGKNFFQLVKNSKSPKMKKILSVMTKQGIL